MLRTPFPRLPPIALAIALAALIPSSQALADGLLAHRADYRVTIGAGDQAPAIGTARQKLTACNGSWKLERDVEASVALTQSLRFDIGSVLRAEETLSGNAFSYRLNRAMNGERSERAGRVSLTRTGGKAVLSSPEGRRTLDLPPETILPLGLIPAVIERLLRGAEAFALETFDAEIISDNFLIKGSLLDPQDLPPRFLNGVDAAKVGARVWPLLLEFNRADRPTDPPMFQTRLRLHETGVISRMVLTYGWVTLGIDLIEFTPLTADSC